jgi:hypothetical protein
VVGVNNPSLSHANISVSPNPGKGLFTVKSAAVISRIEVMNLLGESVALYNDSFYEKELNLSTQPKGVYILKITEGSSTENRKIIIE